MGIESHASKRRLAFPAFVLLLQVIFVITFSQLADYAPDASGKGDGNSQFSNRYPLFMDVQVMIFIGFGFLMTFLRRYGYSAVSFNLLISAMVAQWAIIVKGLLHDNGGVFTIGVDQLIGANFVAATVLISFGAVLGKLDTTQLLFMGMAETALAAANEHICVHYFKVVDIGGSMFIHTFGAYFGIAVAIAVFKPYHRDDHREGSVYHSDLFSMIGTLFLWICWPSFNGALANGDDQHRAIINTFLSLCGCVLTVFAFSSFFDRKAKLDMAHVQNATIAGGVAIGASADLFPGPYGALLIGAASGMLSVVGFKFIQPALTKAKVHDTCGVNNLHGMPGILAGIVAAIVASCASQKTYGDALYRLFPDMMQNQNKTWAETLAGEELEGDGRTGSEQAGFQLAALAVTMGLSIVGGAITGVILRLPIWCGPEEEEVFDDDPLWNMPDDQPSTYTYVTTKEHLPDGAEKFIISQEQWTALHKNADV